MIPLNFQTALVQKDIEHNPMVVALMLTNVLKINISAALALNV